jgi:hypothetical protein
MPPFLALNQFDDSHLQMFDFLPYPLNAHALVLQQQLFVLLPEPLVERQ